MNDLEAAQVQLRDIVRDLEGLRYRLIGVQASVPPSPGENDPRAEVEKSHPAAELRGDIEAILCDRINPAIRDLATVASRSVQSL